MSDHSFLDPNIIGRLMHMTLESRRAMIGSVSGRHRSPMRGSSLEFAQYRKYEIGDDMRRLDWRVWGRTDRAYVKEFEADTNLRMCLVIDTSGSMNYQGPSHLGAKARLPYSKLDIAKRIAGSLAWVAARQGDAVGLATTNPLGEVGIPARRGARHLKAVLDRMERISASGESDLPRELHLVAEKLPRRGMVVILSDLFTDLEELTSSIRHLRHRKHDIVFFHLLDQLEIGFDFDQPMKFIDLEHSGSLLSDPVLVGDSYRQVVSTYLQQLKELVLATGVDYRRLHLQSDIAESLASFLKDRYSRKTGARRS